MFAQAGHQTGADPPKLARKSLLPSGYDGSRRGSKTRQRGTERSTTCQARVKRIEVPACKHCKVDNDLCDAGKSNIVKSVGKKFFNAFGRKEQARKGLSAWVLRLILDGMKVSVRGKFDFGLVNCYN